MNIYSERLGRLRKIKDFNGELLQIGLTNDIIFDYECERCMTANGHYPQGSRHTLFWKYLGGGQEKQYGHYGSALCFNCAEEIIPGWIKAINREFNCYIQYVKDVLNQQRQYQAIRKKSLIEQIFSHKPTESELKQEEEEWLRLKAGSWRRNLAILNGDFGVGDDGELGFFHHVCRMKPTPDLLNKLFDYHKISTR